MIEQTSNRVNQSWMKTLTSKIKIAFLILTGWLKFIGQIILNLFWRFLLEVHAMEQLFTNMYIIYGFLCQLLFLTMCELAILGIPKESKTKEQQGIVGLSALLFYSVFGYFVAKIKDICQSDWSRAVQWAKAIAVVLCIRDKGITYQPDPYYSTITFSYYICTERLFVDLFIKLVTSFKFQIFDCMEHLYVPIILNIYVILCGAGVTAYLVQTPQVMYALFSSYFILYLRMKDLYFNYVKELLLENKTYASFRNATDRDIQKWDDICAVCLSSMNNALVTPCNHLFHPVCLKRCLRTSLQCPLCKHDFIQ